MGRDGQKTRARLPEGAVWMWTLTCQLPVVQFQAVEGIGAVEEDVALGMDTLQLLQGGLPSPQALQQMEVVTRLLQVGHAASPTQARQPLRVEGTCPAAPRVTAAGEAAARLSTVLLALDLNRSNPPRLQAGIRQDVPAPPSYNCRALYGPVSPARPGQGF